MNVGRQFLSGLQSLLCLAFQSSDAWDLFTVQGDAGFERELPSNLNSSLSPKNLNCFCSGNLTSTITTWEPSGCSSRLWVLRDFAIRRASLASFNSLSCVAAQH